MGLKHLLITGLKITTHFKVLAAGLVLAAASSAVALPAAAACMSGGGVYCDQTSVQAYNDGHSTTWGGPGFNPATGVGDVLQDPGHPFDTDRVDATITSSAGNTTLDLKFYTSFNGNDEGAHYADVFLGSNTSIPDSFNYAIALGDQGTNGGLNTPGFYSLPNSNAYETSTQVWGSRTSYIYGGEFQGLDGQYHLSPTVVTGAANPIPISR